MTTNIVNLHTLITNAANNYIAANATVFKSTVQGDQGEQGVKGDDGDSITLIGSQNNGDGTFTLQFSDGSTHTTEDLRGAVGNDGQDADALTVVDITMNPDYSLTIEFSDGYEYTTTSIRGQDGRNIHHIVHISSELPNGDVLPAIGYGEFGEEEVEVGVGGNKDTYAAYADEEENAHVGEIVIQNGDSAYSYAVEGGFTGTREEFILLLGQVDDLVLAATTAIIQAETARDKAEQWADEAEDVEVEVGKYSAKHHAIKAAADATAANIDAGTSSAAAVSAIASESNALTYSNAAGISAGNALVSENNASASETAAALSESNAAASELSASTDASAAAVSASNALTSEANAAASESSAATSEANAAASEVVVANALSTKQDTLISGTNIRTLNGMNVLGSGDLTITAGVGGFAGNLYFSDTTSTIDGAYKTLNYTPDITTTSPTIVCNSGETAGEVYLFDLPIATPVIDAGKWSANFYASVDSVGGGSITQIRYEGFMKEDVTVDPAETETTLFTSTSTPLDIVPRYTDFEITEQVKNVSTTARYGIRVFAVTDSNQDRTVTYVIGDGNASYTNTPLAVRHSQLRFRDESNAHPISAITGLQEILDSMVTITEW